MKTMTFAQEIVCPRCDNRFPLSKLLNLCACGSPLLVRYDLKQLRLLVTKSSLQGRVPTLWRYRELLPLQDDAILSPWERGLRRSLKQRRWRGNSA